MTKFTLGGLTQKHKTGNITTSKEVTALGGAVECRRISIRQLVRHIGIAKDCFSLIQKNIWRSKIRTDTKVKLYRAYILPVLLYGCETWSVTKTVEKCLDAFDTLVSAENFLRISYTRHTPRQFGVLPGAWQFPIG